MTDAEDQEAEQAFMPIGQVELAEQIVPAQAGVIDGSIEVTEIKDISEMILIQDTWTSSVLGRLHEMCTDGLFCDMVLVSSEGIKVLCHSSVMVASCSYFNKLMAALNQTYVNAQMTVHLSLSANIVRQVLAFIYTGKVNVASTDLPQLSHAASFLDIAVLKQLCENATKGLETKEEVVDESQMVEEMEIPQMVEQHMLANQSTVQGERQEEEEEGQYGEQVQEPEQEPQQQQQAVKVMALENGVLHIQEEGEGEGGEMESLVIEQQPDGTVVAIGEDGAQGAIIEGTFEIEGAAEADTAEVLSAIMPLGRQNQGPSYTIQVQGNNSRSTPRHSSDISTWEKVFICQYCNRAFKRKDLLQSHERVHTGDRPFQCSYCSKAFKQKPHLIEHVRQHTGEKPYHCKQCDRHFAYYSHYNKHKLLHAEGGRKIYVCQYCEKTFVSPSCFAAHEREHRGELPFKCTECPQAFALRNKMLDHQRIEHGMHGALECEHCHKRFANASHMREHVRIHTGERPYVCGSCHKGFKTKSTLVKHMEVHLENKPYKCDMCDKAYVRESALLEHRRSHTGEKPFICKYCNVAFARQSTLCNHEKIHTSGRQYRCDICSAAFVRKDDCIKHVMRRHPSGRRFPHSCDICYKLFPTGAKVRRHKERKHGIKVSSGGDATAAEGQTAGGTTVGVTEVVEAEAAQLEEHLSKEAKKEAQFLFTVKKEPLSDEDSEDSDGNSDEDEIKMDNTIAKIVVTEVGEVVAEVVEKPEELAAEEIVETVTVMEEGIPLKVEEKE